MQLQIPKKQLIGYLLIFVAAPIITFVFGSWIDNKFKIPAFPVFPLNLFTGISVIIIGLNLGLKSTKQLYQHGKGLPWGEASHKVETQKLVKSGIYAYTRNPMMLGYGILPIGMGIMFQSMGMVFALSPVVLVLNYLIVKYREEPRLLERFGDDYRKYRDETPFLFPDWRILVRGYLIPYFKRNWTQLSYVLIAELSLFFTAFIVYSGSSLIDIPYASKFSEVLFASIFLLIALIAPKYCIFYSGSERSEPGNSGHHPEMGSNEGYIISFAGSDLYAGCTGLLVGAIFVLIGLITSFFPFEIEVGFWFGVMLVFLGFAQRLINLGSGWVHFLLNVGFVLGDWLMYMAIQTMSLNIFVSIYFITITVVWVFSSARS